MTEDTKYRPVEYVYKSSGLLARDQVDEAPPYTYLLNLNCLERQENAMSSRYGVLLVNRDPDGATSGQNYFFNFPVVSLAKMNFQGNPQRFASLSDGSLWQRNANSQGPYTQIYEGLSGNPWQSVIASCYETALPFLFIYDSEGSIKVAAGSSTPQLTGIDSSPYTLNVLPYAPLLIMIDNFAEANYYSDSGLEDWGWAGIETLDASSGQLITDFSQFYGIGPSGSGGTNYTPATQTTSASVTQISEGSSSQTSAVVSGFPDIVPSAGETISLTVTVGGSVVVNLDGIGNGEIQFQVSPDGGVTWTTFYAFNDFDSITLPTTIVSTSVTTGNLALIQVRVVVTSTVEYSGIYTVVTSGNVIAIYATISNPGAFGPIANGMLSLLNSNQRNVVPVSSVNSTSLEDGIYTQLEVSTTALHYLSASDTMAIYASSNDLVDGFYQVQAITASNSFLIPFLSAAAIGAEGGYVTYAGSASDTWGATPPACVLTDQYSTPYPSQMTAWGFYEWVPPTTSVFPISAWSGTVSAASSTGTVSKSVTLDLNQNNQVLDSDLIVLTLLTSDPENIAQIELQFFVGEGTNNFYQAFISPAYFQGAIAGTELAYEATQNQILANALNLITGQSPGTTSAQLQPTNISTGSGSWQACYIPRGNFLPVGQAGQAGLDWSNVSGWQLSVTTNSNGGSSFSVNGLYLQWGYGPSSFAGIGYDWRQTYYDAATGTESSPCPEQEFNAQFGYLASTSAPIFLRQAAQVTGYYSNDPQVTHVRLYRRGGILASNWVLTVQAPNVTAGGQFTLKDVIGDAFVLQAPPLVLDNDPPVTSSLINPIQTTLANPTTLSGLASIYSTFAPQTVSVVQDDAVFVTNQLVLIGNANNLEEVAVITGGVARFTAILRLEHNAGEPVQVNATPRAKCNLCAIVNLPGGAIQVILAGDESNPQRVYYSKPGQPENFGPENYVDSPSPNDPVMALIDWRGTTLVATQATWYVFVGGAQPYLQPTGATHGIIASQGWAFVEGEIWFRASDGQRAFSGADGKYMTLPVEWIYRTNPECLPPQVSASDASLDVMAFFDQVVYTSYISLNDGQRYRLNYDLSYNRFRQDDVAATAMLWERDTDQLVIGVPVYSEGFSNPELSSNYLLGYSVALDQQYNQDYDDGGWRGGGFTPALTVTTGGWSFPEYATSVIAGNYASAPISTFGNRLQAACAALNVPPLATVTGIAVSFDAWGYLTNTLPVSVAIQLNAISPQLPTANLANVPTPYTLGSNAFQWGFVLTPALINAGLTALVFGGYEDHGLGGTNLNSLVVTVYYTIEGEEGLVEIPIQLNIQTPYRDLGKPHFPKQWNVLETDCNTQGQELQTTLWFDSGETAEIVLPPVNTGTQRQKVQQQINDGDGNQSYSMSIQHTMAVTVAPTLFQENIYAALLADYRSSFDTYWQKTGGQNRLKLWKQAYFDYSATEPVEFSLYANGDMDHPYYQFTLPVQADRSVVRVLFPAMKCRLWRMVGVSTGDFQLWAPVTVESKELEEGSGYMEGTYGVYE